jgi:hypothetical protein
MFGMRHRHDWTFQQFGMVLLNVIFIYMVAGLVFPDFFGDQVVDLKKNFYAHRGWFFSLAVAIIAISVGQSLVLDHKLPPTTDLIFHAIFGVTLFSGTLIRSERYHKTLAVFSCVLFVFYIVLLYAQMR